MSDAHQPDDWLPPDEPIEASGPPAVDPREGRQRHLVRFLQVAGAATLALALLSPLLPGDGGRAAADAMVVIVVGAPVVRLLWLLRRWVRRRDLRFAGVAGLLLLVVAAGAIAGVLSG